jgi:solute:Na+ symporter, SSS family
LRPEKRRLAPPAWTPAVLWFTLDAGPGAVIGNTAFGDPKELSTWWFGIPSIWTWQVLGWASGVGLMWFVGQHMGLATMPRHESAAAEKS